MRFKVCGRLLTTGTRSTALFAAILSTACHPEFTCDIMGTCPGYGEEAGLADGGADGGKVTSNSTSSVVTEGTTSSGPSTGSSDAVTASSDTSETLVDTTTETATATSGAPTTSDTDVECVPVSDEGCGGELPWCLGGETTADGGLPVAPRCVECEDDAHCQWPYVAKEQNGICLDYACTPCELGTSRGCSADAPFCIAGVGDAAVVGDGDASVQHSDSTLADGGAATQGGVQCAECLSEADCGGPTPACVNHVCVECDRDAQCTSPEASRCDLETHECVGCNAVGQCARLIDTPACDINVGRCVECTREEDGACGEGYKACVTITTHPDYQTCSAFQQGGSAQCTECVSDAQCTENYRCVPEVYQEPNLDGGVEQSTGKYYCMRLATPEVPCATSRPFVGALDATSEGGTSGTYCGPAFTTCEAYLDWKTGPDTIPEGQPGAGQSTCFGNGSCGLPGVDDGYCAVYTEPPAIPTNRCTYECGSEDDCPPAIACDKSNPPEGVPLGRGVCDL